MEPPPQLRPDEPIQYQLSRAICHGSEVFFVKKNTFLSRKNVEKSIVVTSSVIFQHSILLSLT